MAYPIVTAEVLQGLGYGVLEDFEVRDNGSVSLTWRHADPQPTEQQITNWATDATPLPNGQLFSQWQAEHGGDAAQTLRRKAKEALDDVRAEQNALIRALALIMLDEINALRGEHGLPLRTANQLRSAIKNKIAAGDADS